MKHIKVKNWSEIPHNFTGIIEWDDVVIEYFLNGKLHRLDGPVRTWPNGFKEYWINDKLICDSNDKDYEQYFYNSKEYKLAKRQEDLLNNMKLIKNII